MTKKVCKIQIVAWVKKKWRFHVQPWFPKGEHGGTTVCLFGVVLRRALKKRPWMALFSGEAWSPPSFFMYLVIIPPFWERILSKYWCGLFLNKKWMRRCRDRSLQNSIARLYNNLSWLLSMAKTTSNIIILMHALHIKHIKQNIIHMYLYIHRHIPAWNFKGG